MDPKEVEIPGSSDPNQPGGRISHLALDIGGDSFTLAVFFSIPVNFLFLCVIVCIYVFDFLNSITCYVV